MELHFFPGENILAVKDKGVFTKRFEAMGGPSAMGNDPHMAEEPTWPGRYIIGQVQTYRTPTWPMSKIKWGTPLQDKPDRGDVWYQMANKNWASVKADVGADRNFLMEQHKLLYGTKKIPAIWVFNDFGPIAIRWFKDLNGNRILDKNERLSGQMFHTTPDNEAQRTRGLPIQLSPSHGCIHLKPQDRDALFSIDAFKPGTTFIVHEYHERIR